MAWTHNPKPPSGIPAGGDMGWGPAKGDGSLRASFTSENQPEPGAAQAGRESRAAMRARLEAERLDLAEKLIKLAKSAESEQVRLNAINSVFDRLDGKAVQATVVKVDPFEGRSAEQLEAIADWLESNGGGGVAAAEGAPKTDGEPA